MGKWLMAAQAVKARLDGKDGLIEQLRQERAEAVSLLEAARQNMESWRQLAEMTNWWEIASGKAIKAGDRVRYALRTYVCIKDHTKALTRSPLDNQYWEQEETQHGSETD